jgi:hypothetical protein
MADWTVKTCSKTARSLFDNTQKWNKKNHFSKNLDQLGDVFLPTVVIAFWRVPFASMMKTCFEPFRLDSKAIWRLSGDQTGCSLLPLSRVN